MKVMMKKSTSPTGRSSDKFMLRLPDGMRDTISELAKDSGRSMNAELVHRIQRTIDEDAALAANGGEQIFKSTSMPHPLSPDTVLVPQVIYNSQLLNDELREVRELLTSIRNVMTDEMREKVKTVFEKQRTDSKKGQ